MLRVARDSEIRSKQRIDHSKGHAQQVTCSTSELVPVDAGGSYHAKRWSAISANAQSLHVAASAENLPQQAQTIESVSGHTYICKRISLTLLVKRLILW